MLQVGATGIFQPTLPISEKIFSSVFGVYQRMSEKFIALACAVLFILSLRSQEGALGIRISH
jgi:hypothetical protein